MTRLRNEFAGLRERVDQYEDFLGHKKLAEELRSTADNWSKKRDKLIERLDSLALAAEGGLLLALRANLDGPLARPLDEGRLGRVHRLGVLGLGTLAPLALVGGVLLRYLVLMAGLASADDPAATWHLSCSTGAQAVSAPD